MKGRELIQKCESVGWVLDRVESSHHIMKHPNKSYNLSIPVHGSKDIPKGLLHKLLKQAGLK